MHDSVRTGTSRDRERYGLLRDEARRRLDDAIVASGLPEKLKEAIRYGSTGPEASRWRAVLVLEAGSVLGTAPAATRSAAAAVEALHCATLSIDDLPSMDDATQRRGQPAMHRRFNEAMAIQASLWLLGISRTLMSNAAAEARRDTDVARTLAELQQRTEDELQLGQFMDLLGSLGKAEVDAERTARLKCGRLFALAAQAAAWLVPDRTGSPGMREELAAALDRFGEEVGLAYQIKDDLDDLAEDGDAATWAGDGETGRPTVVAKHGVAAAHASIAECLKRAEAALGPLARLGFDPTRLSRIAHAMLGRD